MVGFFTPDYAEAASAFSKNLIEHSVSHHLYARAKVDGGWRAQIFQKPATLAVARRDYPDAVLIFMDVDCSIRGDISGIVETRGDVALRIKGRAVGRGYAVKLSSRVIVVMPTSGGTAFIDAWVSECRDHEMGTESALVPTIEHSAGRFSLAALPLRYAGMELRDAPANAVICMTVFTTRSARDGLLERASKSFSEWVETRHTAWRRARATTSVEKGEAVAQNWPPMLAYGVTSDMRSAAWARSSMVRADGS